MAAILNQREGKVREMQQTVKDINFKDANGDSFLHCAAFTGNVGIMRCLLKDMLIFLNEKNDQNKTAVEIAIENGYILSKENVVLMLLERGAILDIELWDKLLTLSLNKDLVDYFKLAFKFGINFNQPMHPVKVSLHKVIYSSAVNILHFFQ